jgi:N-acetylmuramoyl-L-alanine amidase
MIFAAVVGVAVSVAVGVADAKGPPPFVVMIDAGHGGSNTGASGVVEGVYEKRITLAIARALKAQLEGEAGVVVKMTRTDDRYLTLRERVRRANQEGVDVLVSVHTNASPSKGQRGFETWVLTPEALDRDARALSRDEGPHRPGVDADTAGLLDDLERGTAHLSSITLAERMQARLAEARGAHGNRGVRQGPMDVLIGPTMPAVLVEVGFLDHPTEGVELLRHEVREAIARAMASAVLDFRDSRVAGDFANLR